MAKLGIQKLTRALYLSYQQDYFTRNWILMCSYENCNYVCLKKLNAND